MLVFEVDGPSPMAFVAQNEATPFASSGFEVYVGEMTVSDLRGGLTVGGGAELPSASVEVTNGDGRLTDRIFYSPPLGLLGVLVEIINGERRFLYKGVIAQVDLGDTVIFTMEL